MVRVFEYPYNAKLGIQTEMMQQMLQYVHKATSIKWRTSSSYFSNTQNTWLLEAIEVIKTSFLATNKMPKLCKWGWPYFHISGFTGALKCLEYKFCLKVL